MEQRVSISISDGIADVRLVRADKMNALDAAMFEALVAATERLAHEKGVRAVVLSGEGRAFCAGRNLGSIEPGSDDAYGFLDATLTPLLRTMADFPAPTFAAAQGALMGENLVQLDYLRLVDPATFGPLDDGYRGPAVVLISGWPFDSRSWEAQVLPLVGRQVTRLPPPRLGVRLP